MPCTLLGGPVALPPWRELTRAAFGILQYLMRMNLEATLEKLPELGGKLKIAEDVIHSSLSILLGNTACAIDTCSTERPDRATSEIFFQFKFYS